MLDLLTVIATCLCLGACANADGSMPRLGSAAPPAGGPASFNGGYAGTNGGFSNLTTKSAPF